MPDDFLVINGDILTNINLYKFFKQHLKNKKKIDVNIMPFNGMWFDIGRVEDYDFVNINYKKILNKITF